MKDVIKTDINRVQNSKRNRRRQRNSSVYYLLVLLLVVGVGITLSMTLLFNISDIVIVGQSQYQVDEIIEASGISNGDNLVRTDVNEVHDNIMSSLMYVDEVRVKKDFPDSIVIEVMPSVPTAMIEYGETYLLVSKEGKILEKLSEPSKNVPIIKGYYPGTDIITQMVYSNENFETDEKDEQKAKEEIEKKNQEKDKVFHTVCSLIKDNNLYDMVDFDISDIYAISANYQDRISIRLGSSSELDYKLSYAMQILTDQLPTNKDGYLIFRANNQYQYVSKEDMEKHIEEIAEASGIVLETESEENEEKVTGYTETGTAETE